MFILVRYTCEWTLGFTVNQLRCSMVVSGSPSRQNISGIYCQLEDYMPPTTFGGNQKQPLSCYVPHILATNTCSTYTK